SGRKYKKCCGGMIMMNRVNGASLEKPTEEPRFFMEVSLQSVPSEEPSFCTGPVQNVQRYVADVKVAHGNDLSRFRAMRIRSRVVAAEPLIEGAPIERVMEPETAL